MAKVYGGCVEPEGMDLEDSLVEHDCSACGKRGRTRYWEAAEGGGLNRYRHEYCLDCSHQDGDIPFNEAEAEANCAAEQAREHMLRLLIAEQNDAFRRALGFAARWRGHHLQGRAVTTPGFRAIPERTQADLLNAVINFTDWTEDNDPWEDHAFGRVEAHGIAIFWKIDLYDTAYTFGAAMPECATDPEQVRRVLTLYLPSEH